jgi:hypothetical protein
MSYTGFWELVADGQEAPFIEGGGRVHPPAFAVLECSAMGIAAVLKACM